MSENSGPSPSAAPILVPGASIAGGRYRLLTGHGGPVGLHFWQATDTELNRPVALTFVDGSVFSPDQVQDILSNTLRLTKIEAPGLARVLDAVREGSGGIVVAQWVRGGSLREVADTKPSPLGASRALRSLAAAADAAAQAQGVLSIDHPSRIRISIDGNAALAFPATLPGAGPHDDVHGLGGALYALITGHWPLPETGEPAGLPQAPRNADGTAIAANLLNPAIPTDISDTAAEALSAHPGSAEELLTRLETAVHGVDHTTMLEPASAAPTRAIEVPPATPEPAGGLRTGRREDDYSDEGFDDDYDEADPEVEARHRRGFLILLGALAVVVIAMFVAIGVWVSRIFGGSLEQGNIGIGLPTPTPIGTTSSSSSSSPGATIKPVRATVFPPGPDADQPDKADLAIDGNPDSAWTTDTYTDANPFPSFKPGVGLMLDLSSPTALSEITISSHSAGTQVEIRSASSAQASSLSDTTTISAPTTLQPGKTRIPITSSAQVSHVLVWITTLGSTDGDHRAELGDITVSAKS